MKLHNFINENSSYWFRNFRLSAAYYFSKNHKVDLFEQDDHFGGHSYTYDIKEEIKLYQLILVLLFLMN